LASQRASSIVKNIKERAYLVAIEARKIVIRLIVLAQASTQAPRLLMVLWFIRRNRQITATMQHPRHVTGT
jgi:hypothetical protein